MQDSLGRTIDYLRLSITDRCNLRCVYCMPGGGVEWMPHNDMLRFEEITRLCGIMAGLGIRGIKVTGGEPLVRKGAVNLVKSLKTLPGIEQVTLTSNGVLLGEYLDALMRAGIDAVNISLDSMDAENFRRITRAGGLEQILSVIEKAPRLGLALKINCVPLRGINERDIAKIAALARNSPITVRFIELMPLGEASSLQPLPADETAALLEKAYGPLSPAPVKLGSGPASYYTLRGFTGFIGFISPLSHMFCDRCNRLRLGSTGALKPCLSSDAGADLRLLLRGGASDGEIGETIAELVSRKPERHNFGMKGEAAETRRRTGHMFRIGG
jgi:cyclic pyranopterin phosphate synthase